jgi:hypothetical protein
MRRARRTSSGVNAVRDRSSLLHASANPQVTLPAFVWAEAKPFAEMPEPDPSSQMLEAHSSKHQRTKEKQFQQTMSTMVRLPSNLRVRQVFHGILPQVRSSVEVMDAFVAGIQYQ